MQTQIIVRIDTQLKQKISKIAKLEGKNLSEVIRDLLQDYVKSKDISNYIDGLWDRIGKKLNIHDQSEENINKIIHEIRKS